MRIGVDIDGVLRDFQGEAIRKWNEEHPDCQLSIEDWKNHRYFYDLTGGSDESFLWWVANGVYDAPVIDGCQGALHTLKEIGHEIIIISSQHHHPDLVKLTSDWLHKHKIPSDEIHYVYEKGKIDYDIIIDDKPEYIFEAIESGRSAILFEYPWNRWMRNLDMKYVFCSLKNKFCEYHVVHNWKDVMKCRVWQEKNCEGKVYDREPHS